MQSFPNFQTGTRILQTALTELVLFYRRFLNLWEKRFASKARPKTVPIGIQAVMVEIKKFRYVFSCFFGIDMSW